MLEYPRMLFLDINEMFQHLYFRAYLLEIFMKMVLKLIFAMIMVELGVSIHG